jgi:hypothetical protein
VGRRVIRRERVPNLGKLVRIRDEPLVWTLSTSRGNNSTDYKIPGLCQRHRRHTDLSLRPALEPDLVDYLNQVIALTHLLVLYAIGLSPSL